MSDHQAVVRHMETHFGRVRPEPLGHIMPDIGVQIHVLQPRDHADQKMLFTTGMSDRAMTVPAGQEEFQFAELLLRLPHHWPLSHEELRDPLNLWPISWLRNLARFPFENNTWLGGPSTIVANEEPPRPFAPNTELSCLLLLAEREQIPRPDGAKIVLYSLTPLYAEERDYERATGLPELLERFNRAHVTNVVDLNRQNTSK